MSEDRETRLKRLRMRSMRRGIKEMDLILIAFSETELEALEPRELDRYEALLNENDQDLYRWVSGQSEPPDPLAPLIARIAACADGVVKPRSI